MEVGIVDMRDTDVELVILLGNTDPKPAFTFTSNYYIIDFI
jgi:hypothetical protein